MNVKATEDGRVIVLETVEGKVLIAQTPFGVLCTGEENIEVNLKVMEELPENFLVSEFGEETANKIDTCLSIAIAKIEAQLNNCNKMH